MPRPSSDAEPTATLFHKLAACWVEVDSGVIVDVVVVIDSEISAAGSSLELEANVKFCCWSKSAVNI